MLRNTALTAARTGEKSDLQGLHDMLCRGVGALAGRLARLLIFLGGFVGIVSIGAELFVFQFSTEALFWIALTSGLPIGLGLVCLLIHELEKDRQSKL